MILMQSNVEKVKHKDLIFDYIVSSLGAEPVATCDVRLVCGDGAVWGHRLVLAAISRTLLSILSEAEAGDTGDEAVTIIMPDCEVASVRQYFADMFSGQKVDQYHEINSFFGFCSNKVNKGTEIIVKDEELSNETLIDDSLNTNNVEENEEETLSDVGNYDEEYEHKDPLDDFKVVKSDCDVKLESELKTAKIKGNGTCKSGDPRKKMRKCPFCSEEKYMRSHHFANHMKVCSKKNTDLSDKYQCVRINVEGTGNKLFKCKLCEYTTKYIFNVKKHHDRLHLDNRDKPFKCTKCDYQTDEKEKLTRHTENCAKSTCEDCGATFNTISKLRHHIRYKHSESDEYTMDHAHPSGKVCFKCKVCGFENFWKFNMIVHCRRHTQKTEIEVFEPKPCDICGVFLENKTNFKTHMSRVHTEKVRKSTKCEKCGKNVGIDVNSHLCKKNIPCKACGKMFFNRKERDKHQKENVECAQLYSCDQCGMTYNSKGTLNNHIKNIHTEKSECPYCGKKYKKLQFHIDTAHVSDEMKRLKCQDCGKGFLLECLLKKHVESVHLNSKRYQCRYGCDNRFNDSSNRNAHEKKKHGSLFVTSVTANFSQS